MHRVGSLTLERALCCSDGLVLWTARSVEDGSAALVKTPEAGGDQAVAARLRSEYLLAQRIASDAVLRFRELHDDGQVVAVIQEPFGGVLLEACIPPRGFSVREALDLAIQLVQGLLNVHEQGVLHGAMSPRAVLYDPASGVAKYFDLGASAGPAPKVPSTPRLAYMAPEHTGRIARAADERSDLYSVGAVLYHLLCGQPPFSHDDPLELVHSHLARMAPGVSLLRPDIPGALAQIVARLLAKEPGDRYQTARGLLHDLEECRSRVAAGDTGPFRLGGHDAAPMLRLPEQLYGRERERCTLEESLERVRGGRAELLLVSGYSGSGKSILIEQLREPIARAGGYFVAGKFEQLGGAVPYSAIRQALRGLIQQLFNEPSSSLEALRERVVQALSGQGQVLVDVVPEAEQLIGPQPPLEPLGPVEAQHRFVRVFQQFVYAVAGSGRTIVLFLDDWQWADEASLRLVESLICSAGAANLLLAGAYRDNEVSDEHAVAALIRRLRERGIPITELTVEQLAVEDIAALLSDALGRSDADLGQLAAEVSQRTGGNPFFVRAFLRDLHEQGVLKVARTGRWECDIKRLRRTAPPANVVALMAARLARLPEKSREVLKIAACLGSSFPLATLAQASGLAAEQVRANLAPAIEAGAVVAEPKTLRFVHDRVQEAAYSLIAPGSEAELHLSIGRRLLAGLQDAAPGERLMQAVEHLNQGRALMQEAEECRSLARLNLEAGRMARRATAYAAAARHASVGMELLGEHGWESDYTTMLALYELRAECEYLTGHFDVAESLYPRALEAARTPLDRIRILNVKKDQYELQGRYLDAIAVLRTGLALVGVTFPDEPARLEALLREELAQMPANLAGRRIADLVEGPVLDDPLRVATLRMLMGMWPSCYVAGLQALLAVVSVRIANFSLRYGNCEITSAAYVNYSFVAGFITGDYEAAHEYGKVGMALADRYPERSVRAWCCFLFGCGTIIWRRPLREGRMYLEQAVELGIASGNIACASYAASYIVTDSFMLGAPLAEVRALYERYFPFLQQNNAAIHVFGELGTRGLRELAGMPPLDDEQVAPLSRASEFFGAVDLFGRLGPAYLFERSEALELAERALEAVPRLVSGTFKVPETLFYAALVFCRAADTASADTRARLLASVQRLRDRLAGLARHCADNFLHKTRLVEAELARTCGRNDQAVEGYEEAALLAGRAGFVQDEALAYELAARFWRARGLLRLASVSLDAAIRAYETWGAAPKVRWLEQRFADLRSAAVSWRTPPALPAADAVPLDLLSVTKASQAISSEIDLDRLLERLIRIIAENAGARRAVLFLLDEGRLVPAAEADLSRSVSLAGQPSAPPEVPAAVVEHVAESAETVLLADAARDGPFTRDPYITGRRIRSVLCMPVRHKEALAGVVYLENDLSSGAFTPTRLSVLELLLGQVTISLENARLYRSLKESEQRLSSVFSQTVAGIAQTDLGGRFIEVNGRYCEIVGRSAEELYRTRMQDITHPDDLPANMEKFRAMVEGRGGPFSIEKRYIRPDGRVVWVSNSVSLLRDDEGAPKHAVAVSQDISDRRHAEGQLQAQNRRIALLLEAAAVLLTTDAPGAMLGDLFARIRGALDLDAYAIFMVTESGDRLRLLEAGGLSEEHAQAVAGLDIGLGVCGTVALRRERLVGERIQESEDPVFALAKTHGLRACACFPLLAGERLLGALSFGSRTRERLEAEDIEFLQTVSQYVTAAYERLRLIEQLREQDRRKDEFLATLSHELRNPLAPIRTGLQVMRVAGADPALFEQTHAVMERQLRNMVRLVDDLLDVSRISRNKLELRRERVELSSIVRIAAETSRPLVDAAGHALEVSLPSEEVLVDADPVRLAQALANLLNNAAKYTERGGRILLMARTEGNEVSITVRDSGIGIAPEKLPRIFDMFVQADQSLERSYGGLGIGLTLAQRLVQMHGGRIHAHSDGLGKGSEFTIRLPRLPAAARERAADPAAHEPPAPVQPRRRILVVDDNRDAAESLALMLKHWGHEVATAHEGGEAVELASRFRPDLALLDLGMPRVSGYEAARRIRERCGEGPVLVALTGWGQDQDRLRTQAAGFKFHLVKPVEPSELEHVIRAQ